MASRSSIIATLALLTFGAGKRDAGSSAPPSDPWEFDNVDAPVSAKGEAKDTLSQMAMQQWGGSLEGSARLLASAHANTVGGITLKLADRNDPTVFCELYAKRTGATLTFKDNRCTFPVFERSARTLATCRKISGTARRAKDVVLVEATSPDCTAQPLGIDLTLSGKVEPVMEIR